MITFRPFKGVRPPKELVEQMACRPYDVMNTQEAKEESNEYSLLHVTRPDIDLPEGVDLHSPEAYAQAQSAYLNFKEKQWLAQDENPCFYVYAQTVDGRTQYGLVGCVSVEEYKNNLIKKHELTRPEKEDDRMKNIFTVDANIEPVFFTYHAQPDIDKVVTELVANDAEYDFVDAQGVRHAFWVVNGESSINQLGGLFKQQVPALYIADGHHRTAAAARVGMQKKSENASHVGDEEYNFFLAVVFPHNQLNIIDYNRVVKDLNGQSKEEFLTALGKDFEVAPASKGEKPCQPHSFSMYVDKEWYTLTAKSGSFDLEDPILSLDVSILENNILNPILGIKDIRRDSRIDFVGGIRGLEGLTKRVDSGEMAVAFALYPVSIEQLIRISDTGNIMPPKSTWFEPKLRSGLVIHELS